jgi:Zn finger protein HypA/HybF involved in hydrogenase expression
MDIKRYILKCKGCGTEIYSNSNERYCYKCNGKMEVIGKEKK